MISIIPKKTRVGLHIWKGVTLKDCAIVAPFLILAFVFGAFNQFPIAVRIIVPFVCLTIGIICIIPFDKGTKKMYVLIFLFVKYYFTKNSKNKYEKFIKKPKLKGKKVIKLKKKVKPVKHKIDKVKKPSKKKKPYVSLAQIFNCFNWYLLHFWTAVVYSCIGVMVFQAKAISEVKNYFSWIFSNFLKLLKKTSSKVWPYLKKSSYWVYCNLLKRPSQWIYHNFLKRDIKTLIRKTKPFLRKLIPFIKCASLKVKNLLKRIWKWRNSLWKNKRKNNKKK